MNLVKCIRLTVVVLIVFIASSLWYSPLVFGQEFLKWSGFAAAPHPSPLKALCELVRTFVLAYVISHLMIRLNVSQWRDALGIGLMLWTAFPVVLLTGSVLWQNAPWQLAAIHSGDWLVKLTLIPLALTIRRGTHRQK